MRRHVRRYPKAHTTAATALAVAITARANSIKAQITDVTAHAHPFESTEVHLKRGKALFVE